MGPIFFTGISTTGIVLLILLGLFEFFARTGSLRFFALGVMLPSSISRSWPCVVRFRELAAGVGTYTLIEFSSVNSSSGSGVRLLEVTIDWLDVLLVLVVSVNSVCGCDSNPLADLKSRDNMRSGNI